MDNLDSFLYDATAFGDAYYNPATVDGAFASSSELAPSAYGNPGPQPTLEAWFAFEANLASLPATDSLQTMYSTLPSSTMPAPAQDYVSAWSTPSPVSFGAVSDVFGLGNSLSLDNVFAPSFAPANVFASGDVFLLENTLAPGDVFASNNPVALNNTFAVNNVFVPSNASRTIDTLTPNSTPLLFDAPYLPPSPATSVSSLSSVFSVPTPVTSVPTPATSVSSPASSTAPRTSSGRKKREPMITWDEYSALVKTRMPSGAMVECPLDGCNTSFVRSTRCRHLRSHLFESEIPLKLVVQMNCYFCDRLFSRSDARDRHHDTCESNPDSAAYAKKAAARSNKKASGSGPERTQKTKRRKSSY